MSFEQGSASFRIFFVNQDLTEEHVKNFSELVLPSLESLMDDEVLGWVGNRHLLDRKVDKDGAYLGGYLYLSLTQATKKVPKALLDAEAAIEEIAVMEAEKKTFLRRAERQKIKQMVAGGLLPKMPPQLKGIDFIFDPRTHFIYCSATAIKQVDAFVLTLLNTTGITAEPATPELLAEKMENVNAFNWKPTSFSENIRDEVMDGIGSAGRDFLLWLWYYSEMRGGLANIPDVGEVAYMVEGPLTLELEGLGAFETTLRKGTPTFSPEARSALLAGKKPKKTAVKFVRGDEEWAFTLDADSFIFRSLKLPETESFDRVGKFQERMVLLDTFRRIFFYLFQEYVKERKDVSGWNEMVDTMKKWISDRPAP